MFAGKLRPRTFSSIVSAICSITICPPVPTTISRSPFYGSRAGIMIIHFCFLLFRLLFSMFFFFTLFSTKQKNIFSLFCSVWSISRNCSSSVSSQKHQRSRWMRSSRLRLITSISKKILITNNST